MNSEHIVSSEILALTRTVGLDADLLRLRLANHPQDVYIEFFKEVIINLYCHATRRNIWESKIEAISLDFDTGQIRTFIRHRENKAELYYDINEIIEWVKQRRVLLRLIISKMNLSKPFMVDTRKGSINKAPRVGYKNNRPDQNIQYRDEGP